jgi:hypothetical protein
MRKLMFAGAAVAMALLLPVSISTMALAAPAATHDVLTWGKAGGANVGKNQVLKASLAAKTKAVFVSSGGTITCTKSTFTAIVTKNPSKPGTADESLKTQTFSGCTVTGNPDVTGVKNVVVDHTPYTSTISDKKGDPVTVSKPETTLNLISVLNPKVPITCVYKATKTNGAASNKTQTISFKNQTFTKSSGPLVCSHSGKFSATYGPVIDTSVKHDPHVFVN